MLDAALVLARKETERPTLICCKTTIGYGSPKKGGTASSHGSPMGADENAAVRAALGWKDEPFVMPQDIKDAWDARERGAALEGEWKALFAAYAKAYPILLRIRAPDERHIACRLGKRFLLRHRPF